MEPADKDDHGRYNPRPIRVSKTLWNEFGRWTGARRRTEVLIEFMRWYSHQPDSKPVRRPERPPD